MAEKISGACLCGAIRYTAEADVHDTHSCHCKDCQAWTGGIGLAVRATSPVKVEGEDHLGIYKSSDYGERAFCKACGSSLFWRMQDGSMNMIFAGSISDKSSLKLAGQIFIDSKPDYYSFAQETHNMTGEEVFAQFASGQDD